jgi:hypothetical protein
LNGRYRESCRSDFIDQGLHVPIAAINDLKEKLSYCLLDEFNSSFT